MASVSALVARLDAAELFRSVNISRSSLTMTDGELSVETPRVRGK